MEKLNLSHEELKNFFAKYDWESLEALQFFIHYAKSYDTFLSKGLCKSALQDQYTILLYEGYFEGCNEYTDEVILSKVISSIDSLDIKEAKYLKMIIEDSINNIPERFKEEMHKDVREILTRLNNKINETGELSEGELHNFFNKYSVIELQEMNKIYNYVTEHDVETAKKIKNEVCVEKIKKSGQIDLPVTPKNFSLLNIVNKSYLLTNKELNYLFNIVEDAAFYLSFVREQIDTYEFADMNEEDYPIDVMNELELVLYNEKENRKPKQKTLR